MRPEVTGLGPESGWVEPRDHDGLFSARPYFSMREYSCARVRPSSFAARVLLYRAWVSAFTTSERSRSSRLTPPGGKAAPLTSPPVAAVSRGTVRGRCSVLM